MSELQNTSEWKSGTRAERLKLAQISEEQLKGMSTEELMDVTLDYPYTIDMVAFNTSRGGFEAVLRQFNGLQELVKRSGAGEKLRAKYDAITKNGEPKSDEYIMDTRYLKILFE